MAGYNRPGPNFTDPKKFTNATSYNSQIIDQRREYRGAAQEDYGVASDTTLLFSGFDADRIIAAAAEQFLVKEVTAGDNPDFASTHFNADEFKSFSDIKDAAELTRPSDAPDGPEIGVGPTLATQDIDSATSGTLRNVFVGDHNIRGRGFGWSSSRHQNITIGSYLSKKYKFNSQDNTHSQTIQGENIATRYIDYDQP